MKVVKANRERLPNGAFQWVGTQISVKCILNHLPFEWSRCTRCAMEHANRIRSFLVDVVASDQHLIDNHINRNIVVNKVG